MYRIDNTLRVPHEFAFTVFATDPRVVERAKHVYAVPTDDKTRCETHEDCREHEDLGRECYLQNVFVKKAVLNLWHEARKAYDPNVDESLRLKRDEVTWFKEAIILGERVGKRWEETPVETLVAALALQERLHPLGMPVVEIAAGARCQLVGTTYVVFRARRLVLGDEETCRNLLVHDLKVGKNSQLFSSSPVPGCCFSNVAFPFQLNLDTAQVSQSISMLLENLGREPILVASMFYGVTIPEGAYAGAYQNIG